MTIHNGLSVNNGSFEQRLESLKEEYELSKPKEGVEEVVLETLSWIATPRKVAPRKVDGTKDQEFLDDLKKYTEKIIAPLCKNLFDKTHDERYSDLFHKTDAYNSYNAYNITITSKFGKKKVTTKKMVDALCASFADKDFDSGLFDTIIGGGEVKLVGVDPESPSPHS